MILIILMILMIKFFWLGAALHQSAATCARRVAKRRAVSESFLALQPKNMDWHISWIAHQMKAACFPTYSGHGSL